MPQQRLGRIQWGNLTFGPGSQYHVTAIEGLDDLPEIRAEDINRPDQHGDYTSPDTTGARIIPLGLGLRGESPDDLRALTLALRAATQPQRQPAPLQLLDQDVLVYAKVRRRSVPYDAENLWSLGNAALEFYCADPYLYSLEEHVASTAAYSPAAGRTYPLAYSGVGPPTRNLVFNPSAEVDLSNTDQWSTITRARVTTERYVGTASIEHTATSTSAAGSRWMIDPSSGGQTVQAAIWVKLMPGVTWTAGLLGWRSGTGTTLKTVAVTPPATGGWVRVSGSYTLGAGETCDNISLSFTPSAAGGKWYADAAQAETGSTLHDYIDGSRSDTNWEGAANASPSRRIQGTNRVYGDAGSSGRLTAVNDGASPAYPVLRIDGPVANPSIEQVSTGGSITIDATIQAGEYLVIDTRTRAVLLMGTSPRRSWVRGGSQWPLLMPGSNTIAYRGSALPGAPGQSSLLTVTWRDTSL